MNNSMNPLPSLIRASATNTANMAMRKGSRSAWSSEDYDVACETQERLIRACYGRDGDHNEPNRCYIRFSIAEALERNGLFKLKSDMKEVNATIDRMMDGA